MTRCQTKQSEWYRNIFNHHVIVTNQLLMLWITSMTGWLYSVPLIYNTLIIFISHIVNNNNNNVIFKWNKGKELYYIMKNNGKSKLYEILVLQCIQCLLFSYSVTEGIVCFYNENFYHIFTVPQLIFCILKYETNNVFA